MTKTTNDPTAESPRYRGAFARLAPSIRAREGNLLPVNVDVMDSVRTTEGILPKIAAQKDVIAKQLPGFDIQLFADLEDRALALGHAQTVYENALQPPPILQSLSDDAYTTYDIVSAEANMLLKRRLLPPQALSKLKGGNGYRNLVDDMFATSEALRNNWDKVSARTTLTLQELDHLENLADQINQALGLREQMPELQAAAARDRQAAYTLFVEAYNEVRAAIGYVRRKEDDVDTLMPSLFAGRGGSKRKTTDDPPKPTPPITTPSTNTTNPPVVAAPTTPMPTTQAAEPKADQPKAMTPEMSESGPFMH
jgi:hypothetical protein